MQYHSPLKSGHLSNQGTLSRSQKCPRLGVPLYCGPLHDGHIRTTENILYKDVSLLQRWNYAAKFRLGSEMASLVQFLSESLLHVAIVTAIFTLLK